MWLEKAETMQDAALTKRAVAGLYNNMGTVRWQQGQTDAAIAFFEKSRDVKPEPNNPSVQSLRQLGR